MRQIIFDNYLELSVKTAEMIADLLSQKPDALLCFPAGDTSLGTFEQLVGLNRAGRISFKDCRIAGLDEWVNIGEKRNENCLSFLKNNFFDHIDISLENFCFFDGEASDLKQECRKTDDFINRYGPIDLILLGVGMNGHLGLNEPGTSFDLYSHLVDLSETTKIVGQKYFSGKIGLSTGITLGIKSIMEAKEVVLQLSGVKKAEIVKQLVDSEISPIFPASVIKTHSNAYLLLDREAAENL